MFTNTSNNLHTQLSSFAIDSSNLFNFIIRFLYRALENCQRRIDKPRFEVQDPTESNAGISDRALRLCDNLRLACQVSLLDIDEWIRECNQDSWFDVFSPVNKDKGHHRLLRLQISCSNLIKAKIRFEEDELRRIISFLQCTDSESNEEGQDIAPSQAVPSRKYASLLITRSFKSI